MILHHDGASVRVHAPAKVNLFLEVLGRRPDGYHDLATLMAAVGLYDTLEIRESASDAVTLTCDHPGLSCGPDNLVVRATELLRLRLGVQKGVSVHLRKRIPMAAGLAGGSSDAAGTLAGLDRLWGLGLSRAELIGLGAELGSDVSFFFAGPAAWCTGRGEVVEPLPLGARLHLVLLCPSVGLATKDVFRALTVPADRSTDVRDGSAMRLAARAGDVGEMAKAMFNRLQAVAESLCPAVAVARRRLEELRPAGVLMSGSGTTVFALCRGLTEAQRITRSLASGPDAGALGRVHAVLSCD